MTGDLPSSMTQFTPSTGSGWDPQIQEDPGVPPPPSPPKRGGASWPRPLLGCASGATWWARGGAAARTAAGGGRAGTPGMAGGGRHGHDTGDGTGTYILPPSVGDREPGGGGSGGGRGRGHPRDTAGGGCWGSWTPASPPRPGRYQPPPGAAPAVPARGRPCAAEVGAAPPTPLGRGGARRGRDLMGPRPSHLPACAPGPVGSRPPGQVPPVSVSPAMLPTRVHDPVVRAGGVGRKSRRKARWETPRTAP